MAVISNLENAVLACNGQDMGDSWAFQEVPLDAVLLHDSTAGSGRTRSALPSRHTVDGSIFDELLIVMIEVGRYRDHSFNGVFILIIGVHVAIAFDNLFDFP